METSKVISDKENPQLEALVLTPEENKRLADFFSLLIEIDQRNKRRSNEQNI